MSYNFSSSGFRACALIRGPQNTPTIRSGPVKYIDQHLGPRTIGANHKCDVSTPQAPHNLPADDLLPSPSLPSTHGNNDDDSIDDEDEEYAGHGGMTTFERMLTPPVSTTKPLPKEQDDEPVTVFLFSGNNGTKPNKQVGAHRGRPWIRHPPFRNQLSDPSKQPGGSHYCKRIRINARRKQLKNAATGGSGSDGDDEDGDKSSVTCNPSQSPGPDFGPGSSPCPAPASPATPPVSVPSDNEQLKTPLTPNRPVTRSQTNLKRTRSQTEASSPPTTPSPSTPRLKAHLPPPLPIKRRLKLKAPANAPVFVFTAGGQQTPSPTIGERASKRQRNSVGHTDLSSRPISERTRSAQKAADEKLRLKHEFDPKFPGSVTREQVVTKSGAEQWKREVMCTRPWNG